MKQDIPKTGLATRMREWMKAQRRPFTKRDVYVGLGIDDPAQRATIRNAVADFEVRGEIIVQPPDKRIRLEHIKNNGDMMRHRVPIIPVNRYRYRHTWRGGQKGSLQPRIYKAIYVSGTSDNFAVTDILRLVSNIGDTMPHHVPDIPDRAWIDKIVRRLRRSGHLAIVGRRLCAHGAGAEKLYHVTNRDKFRLEVMR